MIISIADDRNPNQTGVTEKSLLRKLESSWGSWPQVWLDPGSYVTATGCLLDPLAPICMIDLILERLPLVVAPNNFGLRLPLNTFFTRESISL